MDQFKVANIFWHNAGNGNFNLDNDYEDCLKIKEIVKQELDIEISAAEAGIFWKWRSNEWDASFLGLRNDPNVMREEIKDWFMRFYDNFYNDDEDI